LDTVEPLIFFYREEMQEKGRLKKPPTAHAQTIEAGFKKK
jgi:hypothetical protein